MPPTEIVVAAFLGDVCLELALEPADPDEAELLWLLAEERAKGLSEPDELQRRAEETIWEADREDRERAERFPRGLHTAEAAAPRRLSLRPAWPGFRPSSTSVSCAPGPALPAEQTMAPTLSTSLASSLRRDVAGRPEGSDREHAGLQRLAHEIDHLVEALRLDLDRVRFKPRRRR